MVIPPLPARPPRTPETETSASATFLGPTLQIPVGRLCESSPMAAPGSLGPVISVLLRDDRTGSTRQGTAPDTTSLSAGKASGAGRSHTLRPRHAEGQG